ncbi:MAG TPA: thiol-disulfide oxidoreductase DCC family protein [Cyclobacteriaceae bacterium]|nr:thiol-disulfide oxidoreductase DCC family protein [Cyclobacteriaceae bacterium]
MGAPGEVRPDKSNIVLFDGVCNLCSGAVRFIIKRDPSGVFKFASLQSTFGQQRLDQFKIDKNVLHSIILVRDNQFLHRSDAALEIARQLNGGWPALYVFKILPRFLRDGIYNLVARYRYRLFGKKDECWIPTPELKDRFLE